MPEERIAFSGTKVGTVIRSVDGAGEVRRMMLNPPTVGGTDTEGPIYQPMIIVDGQVTVTDPLAAVDVRTRGSTNGKRGAVGEWTFEAGPAGVTYFCIVPRDMLEYDRQPFDLASAESAIPQRGAVETLLVICEGTVRLQPADVVVEAVSIIELVSAQSITAEGGRALVLGLRR